MVRVSALDEWWCTWLGATAEQLHTGGVVVAEHVDHVGIFEKAPARGALVYGPARWLGPFGKEPPANLELALDRAREHLGDRVTQVLGPAWYGYADRASLADREDGFVHGLGSQDPELAERLRLEVDACEWAEAGMDSGADVGVVVDKELLSVANLGQWRGMPSIGFLTHPAHRGRGLARQVVRAAAHRALADASHVQYRAWERNAASIAVAEHVGFAFYARAVVVDVGGR